MCLTCVPATFELFSPFSVIQLPALTGPTISPCSRYRSLEQQKNAENFFLWGSGIGYSHMFWWHKLTVSYPKTIDMVSFLGFEPRTFTNPWWDLTIDQDAPVLFSFPLRTPYRRKHSFLVVLDWLARHTLWTQQQCLQCNGGWFRLKTASGAIKENQLMPTPGFSSFTFTQHSWKVKTKT